MEEQRKGDARIYVISALFFVCILGGGVFFCLYIFLPPSPSTSWYPIAGMLLVAIPWSFWFFLYVYACFKPAAYAGVRQIRPSVSPAPDPTSGGSTAAAVTSSGESPPSGGGRRVQFGGVTVVGEEGNAGGDAAEEAHSDGGRKLEGGRSEVASKECEMPLTSSASS